MANINAQFNNRETWDGIHSPFYFKIILSIISENINTVLGLTYDILILT